MSSAGYLRDRTYHHTDGPEGRSAIRPLGTDGAVQLATAVALEEEYGVQNLSLHSSDEGKKKDRVEEKMRADNWT
jgi:hypothetical protein